MTPQNIRMWLTRETNSLTYQVSGRITWFTRLVLFRTTRPPLDAMTPIALTRVDRRRSKEAPPALEGRSTAGFDGPPSPRLFRLSAWNLEESDSCGMGLPRCCSSPRDEHVQNSATMEFTLIKMKPAGILQIMPFFKCMSGKK